MSLLYKYQKGNTLKISDLKEFAYRNKMYNDSLNLYKESEKARDEQFEKYNVQFTDFNKKDAINCLPDPFSATVSFVPCFAAAA